MMSISFHDRIGGQPAMVNAMEQFIAYTKTKAGVVYMRKDDIAKMVQSDPATPVDNAEEKFNN
jgi:hypothetical protein